MKIIAFEEHYGLRAIHEAATKANDPYALVLERMKNSGKFPNDPKTGCPPGIFDLEPSLSRELTRQANDTVAATISKYPDRYLGFATLPMIDPAAAARELER